MLQRRETGDEAALEVVRRAIQPETTRSIRQTLNACLLIAVARRRTAVASVALVLAAALAAVHYWHALVALGRLLARLPNSWRTLLWVKGGGR